MTPNDAALAVIIELRQRIDGLEQVNAALTDENGRLHDEVDRLHDEAGN